MSVTGRNDVALYGEFYCGLAERIKDQLLNLERPRMLEQLKVDALKCDNRYWERQHEKLPIPTSRTQHRLPTAPGHLGPIPHAWDLSPGFVSLFGPFSYVYFLSHLCLYVTYLFMIQFPLCPLVSLCPYILLRPVTLIQPH